MGVIGGMRKPARSGGEKSAFEARRRGVGLQRPDANVHYTPFLKSDKRTAALRTAFRDEKNAWKRAG